MRYGILGPLEVSRAGQPVTPSTPQPRTVLAALLVNANRWVPLRTLVDELWPAGAPRTARVIVQMSISKLRKALCPGVEVGSPGQLIRTSRSGYLLSVADGEFDQDEFVSLADQGKRALAEGRVDTARQLLDRSLLTWRGEALGDVESGAVIAGHAQWLAELRLATMDSRVRIDLALGRHRELIPELSALLSRDPAQERLAGSLMVALHRAGRGGEAREVFDRVREHVGAMPGSALCAVLNDPSSWELPAVQVDVCAQLPRQVGDFTGRADLVDQIGMAIGESPVVLCGPGGIGKTTLAVRAAHRWRPRFPDGQLFAELRGTEPVDVLGQFLAALGVTDIPAGLLERQQLFRSRTADRRVLVLLDDAMTEAQVRPLLPGGVGCAVIVTARGRLAGLEGATAIDVGVLTSAESVTLLSAIVGHKRVAMEGNCAAELVRLCGFLPLAVRIAGAKLAARPYEFIADLVDRIRDERHRLAELRVGDLDVRASLEVGYQARNISQRKVLRLLGLLGSADVAPWAVAAMLDVDTGSVAALLDGLVDAQLLQIVGRDRLGQLRYRPHELVRVFGHDRLLAEDSLQEREFAVQRLLRAYLAVAVRADQKSQAGRFPVAACGVWTVDPDVLRRAESDPAGWRAAESAALSCAVRLAHRYGEWQLASSLAEACPPRYESRQIEVIGLLAARRTGDLRAQAVSLCRLGDLHWEGHGRARRAHVYYDMACRMFTELDDHGGLGRALAARADVDVERGDIDRAQVSLAHGLAMLRSVDDWSGQVDVLRQLGSLLSDRGEVVAATSCFTTGLDLARSLGDQRREAHVGKQLADVLRRNGQIDRAGQLLDAALRVSDRLADRHWEAHVLRSLGELERSCGNLGAADDHLSRSLEIFQELGHRHATAYTLRSLGELSRQQGRTERAGELLETSLSAFVDLDDRRGQAYALLGLGPLRHSAGDAEAGVRALLASVRLFDRLGFPVWRAEAVEALDRLASV